MPHEQAKAIIEKIRGEKLKGYSEDLLGALKIFAEQLNTEATHFVWELIQNAEDNEYEASTPELRLRIEASDPTQTTAADGCLIAQNNEDGFQEKHVRGICSVGRSSKSRSESPDYIGEKGIGFKSVFRVSDRPHIFSNGFQFRFSKPSTPDELGYIVPEWVEDEDVPAQVQDGLTTILLPLKPGVMASVAEQLAKIAPESILFLRKLKRLELGKDNVFSRSDTKSNPVLLRCNAGESRYFLHSKLCPVSSADRDSSRSDITQSEITIAFPIKSHSVCSGRIFAFLPTRLDSGLPFLINADFILNSNREGLLEDRRWNQALRNSISAAFVEAFMALLKNAEGKQVAYRFVPVAGDLTPAPNFFAPVISPVQNDLRSKKCILTKDGDCVLPEHAFVAGKLANKVLTDAPRSEADVRLLHPEWECDWEKRLKPLGVRQLTFRQLFDACNDPAWLKSRDTEWWETLYLLCSQCKASAETIGKFPLLPCEDGNCRPINSSVCFKDEGQAIPESLLGPGVILFSRAIQARLQTNQPEVWQWLKEVSGLRQFTIQSYIGDQLLDWMVTQPAEVLLQATRFVADNLEGYLGEVLSPMHRIRQRKLRDKMPWLLADGSVLRPEQRGGKCLATPEILEGETGWNVLFPALNRHFSVIHDDYCSGLEGQSLEIMCKLFSVCGATSFPSPQSRVANRQLDWSAPGWLLGLDSVGQNETIERKVKALERWLKAKGTEATKEYLFCHTANHANEWEQTVTPSEFGLALKIKAWLRTSAGCVVPRTACMRTPELQDFFGALAAYVEADLPAALLEYLGVKTHLTAEVLVARLREMASTTSPDVELVQKIYRRLQDTTFDPGVFSNEALVFLSSPQPRWRKASELTWVDTGDLFDSEFGYVELTYGKKNESELRRFFSDKLKIPEHPNLEQYAAVWQTLCSAPPVDRAQVEKKLRIILTQMASSQNELPNNNWWLALIPALKIWTTAGRFVSLGLAYMPDSALAVEIFKDHATGPVPIAFLPKATKQEFAFLEHMGCKSLAETIQPRLSKIQGGNPRAQNTLLTAAAIELVVLLICNKPRWQDHQASLQFLLKTREVGVDAITINYSLRDNPAAGTQSRPSDAYWDREQQRLLLREGVDPETQRDAVAKSIAAQFFGDSKITETEAEFFKLLMATPARAKKIKSEHANWNLNTEQEAWLREQNWQTVLINLETDEPPTTPRPNRLIAPGTSTRTTAADSTTAASTPSQRDARPEPAGTAAGSQPSSAEATSGRGETSREQPRPPSPVTSEAKADQLTEIKKTEVKFGKRRRRTNRRSPEPRPSQGVQRTDRPEDAAHRQAEQDEKKRVERAGIDCAIRHLKEDLHYTEVVEMGQKSPGFDLLAKRASDELRIELKSHKSTATTLVLTKPEWDEYLRCQRGNQHWELWNIENALTSTPIITRYNTIPVTAIMPRQYQLNLADCFHTENQET
jgi:hypothetical protein